MPSSQSMLTQVSTARTTNFLIYDSVSTDKGPEKKTQVAHNWPTLRHHKPDNRPGTEGPMDISTTNFKKQESLVTLEPSPRTRRKGVRTDLSHTPTPHTARDYSYLACLIFHSYHAEFVLSCKLFLMYYGTGLSLAQDLAHSKQAFYY